MNGKTGGSASRNGKNNEEVQKSHPAGPAAENTTNRMDQWTSLPGHWALIATPLVSCL